MNKTEVFDNQLQELSRFGKVISHPARLSILKYLASTSTCISGDISDELPLSRTTVNQHLSELKEVGLIKGHIEGVKMKYCLDGEKVKEMKNLLTSFLEEIQVPEDFICQ